MSAHRARFWHRADDGRVQCDLCPRECRLRPGQRGFCYVRLADEDGLVLDTYGRSSGFCLDPIEKKPLRHYLPGTSVLSFGTAGCNLGCRFCQNWDISTSRQQDTLTSQAAPEAIAAAAEAWRARSVAYTYNDPVIFAEYAIDIAHACRERGVRNVAVTAGYVNPAARQEFFASMDAANVDLKGFSDAFYRQLTGGRLSTVLDTVCHLRETGVWLELTTLLIPGHNDSDTELTELCSWVVRTLGPQVPLHFTAFHPDHRMKDVPRTPLSTLRRAREIGLAAGLWFVYTGNLRDPDGDTTFCRCGLRLIERSGYTISSYRLTSEGRCPQCGFTVPGHFEATPGDFGTRRLPITITATPESPA